MFKRQKPPLAGVDTGRAGSRIFQFFQSNETKRIKAAIRAVAEGQDDGSAFDALYKSLAPEFRKRALKGVADTFSELINSAGIKEQVPALIRLAGVLEDIGDQLEASEKMEKTAVTLVKRCKGILTNDHILARAPNERKELLCACADVVIAFENDVAFAKQLLVVSEVTGRVVGFLLESDEGKDAIRETLLELAVQNNGTNTSKFAQALCPYEHMKYVTQEYVREGLRTWLAVNKKIVVDGAGAMDVGGTKPTREAETMAFIREIKGLTDDEAKAIAIYIVNPKVGLFTPNEIRDGLVEAIASSASDTSGRSNIEMIMAALKAHGNEEIARVRIQVVAPVIKRDIANRDDEGIREIVADTDTSETRREPKPETKGLVEPDQETQKAIADIMGDMMLIDAIRRRQAARKDSSLPKGGAKEKE